MKNYFYRKESRIIRLKNSKLIPVRWRIIGIGQDGIGQEFSTKTDTGIVEPLSTYELQLNYYASRPRSPASQKNKLQLKLEVCVICQIDFALHNFLCHYLRSQIPKVCLVLLKL